MELRFVKPTEITKKLTKPEYRFVKFIETVEHPITEEKIKLYWSKNVARNTGKWISIYNRNKKEYEWKWYDYEDEHIRVLANAWFDRWIGKFFRLEMQGKLNFLNYGNELGDSSAGSEHGD